MAQELLSQGPQITQKGGTAKPSQAANLRSKANNAKASKEAKEATAKQAGLAQMQGNGDPNQSCGSDSNRSAETMDDEEVAAFWGLVQLIVRCHESENKDVLLKPKEK